MRSISAGPSYIQLTETLAEASKRLLAAPILQDAAMMARGESIEAFEEFKKALKEFEYGKLREANNNGAGI